jgi:hypothetical protein
MDHMRVCTIVLYWGMKGPVLSVWGVTQVVGRVVTSVTLSVQVGDFKGPKPNKL